MQVLCESAVWTDAKVRVASLECLVKIASLYYDKLAPYMQKIFNVCSNCDDLTVHQITLEAIKKDEESVAQQAVEFWSTICDEEIYLMEEAEEVPFVPANLIFRLKK